MSLSPNPHNLIEGMSFDRLMDRALTCFPNSTILQEEDGNIVISLNHHLVDGIVTPFEEVCDECGLVHDNDYTEEEN